MNDENEWEAIDWLSARPASEPTEEPTFASEFGSFHDGPALFHAGGIEIGEDEYMIHPDYMEKMGVQDFEQLIKYKK